jgi:hypothetical protein
VKPYSDETLAENAVLRRFDESIDPIELMWHRDDEDRLIEAVSETDWYIQLENELPKKFEEKVFIPRHEWHRLIKGTGDLAVKITKYQNANSHRSI